MALKEKKKGGPGSSSSSKGKENQARISNPCLFSTPISEKLWETYKSKPILLGKPISFIDCDGLSLKHLYEQQGWVYTMVHLDYYYPNLIRLLYSNLVLGNNQKSTNSYVKVTKITFSIDDLCELFVIN